VAEFVRFVDVPIVPVSLVPVPTGLPKPVELPLVVLERVPLALSQYRYRHPGPVDHIQLPINRKLRPLIDTFSWIVPLLAVFGFPLTFFCFLFAVAGISLQIRGLVSSPLNRGFRFIQQTGNQTLDNTAARSYGDRYQSKPL
jgi:hypothetical protein